MTELSQLCALIPKARLTDPTAGNLPIASIAYDSRRVTPGALFCCIRGANADGLRFLPDAVAKGAVAALVQEAGVLNLPVPAIVVPDVRAAMGPLAAGFHDYPSRFMQLAGVTGTNGKTTTTQMIMALARGVGRCAGVIGTIGARINDEFFPGDRTTPEAPDLQALLARMRAADTGAGVTVAMEVSSHALAQGRVSGCEFDVGVFTNLTQDHLDYHATMDEYFQAKALLFTEYPTQTAKMFTAIINVDDAHGQSLARLANGPVVTYGVHEPAELMASDIRASATGLGFRLTAPEGEYLVGLKMGGLFNVSNALAALGAGRALGLGLEQMLSIISEIPGVPGRFESVFSGQDFSVIVDYAHSPDGLSNVLRAGRALHPKRILLVFGCGGDRDKTKRPLMGNLAAESADYVVVTSDNPRSEDPAAIANDILEGIPAGAADRVETILDRRQAIQYAIDLAEEGDLVLIAGKGHEDYQIFANETIHFDDREEARKALAARPVMDI